MPEKTVLQSKYTPTVMGTVVDAPTVTTKGIYEGKKVLFSVEDYRPGQRVRILNRNPKRPGEMVVSLSSEGMVVYHEDVSKEEVTEWIMTVDTFSEVWLGKEAFQVIQHVSVNRRITGTSRPFLVRGLPNPELPLREALHWLPFIKAIGDPGLEERTSGVTLSSGRHVNVTRETSLEGVTIGYSFDSQTWPFDSQTWPVVASTVPCLFTELYMLNLKSRGVISTHAQELDAHQNAPEHLRQMGCEFVRWPILGIKQVDPRTRILSCSADTGLVDNLVNLSLEE